MMTARDVAEYLAVSVNTVRRMSERGDIPKPVRLLSRVVRWDRRAIEACLDRNRDGYVDLDESFERWAKNRASDRLVIRFEGRRLLTLADGQARTAPPAVMASALARLGIGGDDPQRLADFVFAQPAPGGGTIGETISDMEVELTMRGGKIAVAVRECPRDIVRRRVPG